MPYAVLLRFDSAGSCPVILRDDSEPLPGGDGVRYRFIAETDDHGEAVQVADSLGRQCAAGEIGRRQAPTHEGPASSARHRIQSAA